MTSSTREWCSVGNEITQKEVESRSGAVARVIGSTSYEQTWGGESSPSRPSQRDECNSDASANV